MTPESQRIAIATACGWDCDPLEAHGWKSRGQWAKHATVTRDELISKYSIPDYLNDLNAMHEAEKVLTKEQAAIYHNQIDNLQEDAAADCPAAYYWLHATASQRAEAFLRCLGKWTD